MKLTIKTQKFQEMVAKAAKGASENKLLPITSMMAIELKSNKLTLTTTDTANTLKIIADKIQGDDFYVVVPVDVFSKLVAKTTVETITLTLKENSLEVKGNGVYNIALPMDEEGLVRFPEYSFSKRGVVQRSLNLTSIKNILNINKAAIAKTIETPCLCGYYIGERVLTTNETVICFNDMNLLGIDVLISPTTMELLALSPQEKIDCYYRDGWFLFETPEMILHGAEHDDKQLFPVEDITSYLSQDFDSSCALPKALVQNVIDRLALFIEPYDKNGVYLTFTPEGLRISNKQSKSSELISYIESQDFKPFQCYIDINLLKSQIDAIPEEKFSLYYGHPAAVQLKCGKITQIIALLEDEAAAKNV